MARPIDEQDARLLNVLQEGVPLVGRPFEEVGKRVGLSEEDVLARIKAMKTPPAVIRQISAIFDTKALGYSSTLVAAKVEEEKLEGAVKAINAHPGVTHNYLRNHAYNLWYTVAVPPDSRLGLEKTVQVLHQESGAVATRMFPTMKLYKIGVSFDMSGETDATARSEKQGFTQADRAVAVGHALTDADKRMIRVFQQDLPIVQRPFAEWSGQAGVSEEELLAAARKYLEQKRMRRFSAVLHHRQAGFGANGMGVWAVAAEKADEFGATAGSFAAVSHCYLRPTYKDWPYSVFTMVHGTSEADCNAALKAISDATGVREYSALFSSKEFKKVRLKYFLGDIEGWEEARVGGV